MLCARFDWKWLSGSEEKAKMWKFNNNKYKQEIPVKFDQKSAMEPLAQVR